jgi:hypothetical protein
MWAAWFDGILPAFSVAVVWICVLALASAGLTTTRSPYLNGLGAAVVAYLGQVGLWAAVVAAAPATPAWLLVVAIPPLVEEAVRLIAAADVERRTDWRGWLVFGAAYGSFEAGLKLGDGFFLAVQQGGGAASVAVRLAAPIVPFLLHVFLTVTVFALLRARVPAWMVFIGAALLHALHNWSAAAWMPIDYSGLALALFVRSVVFLALIALVLQVSIRWAKATKERPG